MYQDFFRFPGDKATDFNAIMGDKDNEQASINALSQDWVPFRSSIQYVIVSSFREENDQGERVRQFLIFGQLNILLSNEFHTVNILAAGYSQDIIERIDEDLRIFSLNIARLIHTAIRRGALAGMNLEQIRDYFRYYRITFFSGYGTNFLSDSSNAKKEKYLLTIQSEISFDTSPQELADLIYNTVRSKAENWEFQEESDPMNDVTDLDEEMVNQYYNVKAVGTEADLVPYYEHFLIRRMEIIRIIFKPLRYMDYGSNISKTKEISLNSYQAHLNWSSAGNSFTVGGDRASYQVTHGSKQFNDYYPEIIPGDDHLSAGANISDNANDIGEPQEVTQVPNTSANNQEVSGFFDPVFPPTREGVIDNTSIMATINLNPISNAFGIVNIPGTLAGSVVEMNDPSNNIFSNLNYNYEFSDAITQTIPKGFLGCNLKKEEMLNQAIFRMKSIFFPEANNDNNCFIECILEAMQDQQRFQKEYYDMLREELKISKYNHVSYDEIQLFANHFFINIHIWEIMHVEKNSAADKIFKEKYGEDNKSHVLEFIHEVYVYSPTNSTTYQQKSSCVHIHLISHKNHCYLIKSNLDKVISKLKCANCQFWMAAKDFKKHIQKCALCNICCRPYTTEDHTQNCKGKRSNPFASLNSSRDTDNGSTTDEQRRRKNNSGRKRTKSQPIRMFYDERSENIDTPNRSSIITSSSISLQQRDNIESNGIDCVNSSDAQERNTISLSTTIKDSSKTAEESTEVEGEEITRGRKIVKVPKGKGKMLKKVVDRLTDNVNNNSNQWMNMKYPSLPKKQRNLAKVFVGDFEAFPDSRKEGGFTVYAGAILCLKVLNSKEYHALESEEKSLLEFKKKMIENKNEINISDAVKELYERHRKELDEKKIKFFESNMKIFYGRDAMKDYLDYCDTLKGYLWYFNGSGFDNFLHIQGMIDNHYPMPNDGLIKHGSRIIAFKHSAKLNVRDLYLFIGSSLEKACKNWGVPVDDSKKDFNHDLIFDWQSSELNKSTLTHYLMFDIISLAILYKIYSKIMFDSFHLDITNAVTPTKFAVYAWMKTQTKDVIEEIYIPHAGRVLSFHKCAKIQ